MRPICNLGRRILIKIVRCEGLTVADLALEAFDLFLPGLYNDFDQIRIFLCEPAEVFGGTL